MDILSVSSVYVQSVDSCEQRVASHSSGHKEAVNFQFNLSVIAETRAESAGEHHLLHVYERAHRVLGVRVNDSGPFSKPDFPEGNARKLGVSLGDIRAVIHGSHFRPVIRHYVPV